MVLADLVPPSSDQSNPGTPSRQAHVTDNRPPVYKPIEVEPLKKTEPDFIVNFTGDKNGFYTHMARLESGSRLLLNY
jgi:hypothetical protein